MIGDDRVIEKHHDVVGIGPHQNRAPRSLGVDAVFVPVVRDQAGRRGPHRLLGEPREGAAMFDEMGAFFLEHLPDCPFPELRMLRTTCIGKALIGEPGVQLVQRFYLRPPDCARRSSEE